MNIEKNNLLKQQLNEQNNQFNKTISDFDKRMLEALNKIPRVIYFKTLVVPWKFRSEKVRSSTVFGWSNEFDNGREKEINGGIL